MSRSFEQIESLFQADRPVCITTVVETQGATPRKPGATMLAFPDGTQRGTLGGGPVEAEVKQRALRMLEETYRYWTDRGQDDVPIRERRMTVLFEAVCPGDDTAYFRRLYQDLTAGRECVEAFVLDPDAAGGGKQGDRFLLDGSGFLVAARRLVESTAVPDQLFAQLPPLTERPKPYVVCGLSIVPHLRRCRLVIVGAGEVGQHVAKFAADVDFDVWIVVDDETNVQRDRFPRTAHWIVDSFDIALPSLTIDNETYCVIVTRRHSLDEQALFHLAETSAGYIGMIGNQRKIQSIFESLRLRGVSRGALDRVRAPLGIDIGSQTVEEIAISIVAELIGHRNLGRFPRSVHRTSSVDAKVKEEHSTDDHCREN